MQKIIDYLVIKDANIDWFTKKIKESLENGFQPWGKLKVNGGDDKGQRVLRYIQAMVKYGEPE